MHYKTLNTITAFLSLINSAFFLIAPSFSLLLMGTSTNAVGLMNTRIAGASALGMAVVTWRTRNTESSEVQNIVSTGNLTMFILLVIVDIFGLLSDTINFTGWLFLTADLFLGIGYGVFLWNRTVKTKG